MSTKSQIDYISSLTVRKTKEFKEVKELLIAHNIASSSSKTIADAGTISDVCNALTDKQASDLITALIATKDPQRATSYNQTRVKKTISILDDVKNTVTAWSFN